MSLSGAQQKGRELETAAVATAVARPSSNVTAARWGGGAEGAPVLVAGTAAGQVCCTSPWPRRATSRTPSRRPRSCPSRPSTPKTPKTPKAMRKRKPSSAGSRADRRGQRRQPARAERAVSGGRGRRRRRARGRRRSLPAGLRGGPAAAPLTTIEAQSTASAVVLSRDGRWLAVASAETITLHRLPESMQQEEPAALGRISEEAAQEEFDASVAEIAKVAFVLPASGAVPTLHWVFATPMEATSLLVVKPDSHVVAKYGLRADAEDGGAPPLYAAWQMAANVSASCLLQDSDGTTRSSRSARERHRAPLGFADRHVPRGAQAPREGGVRVTVHRHKYLIAGAADGRVPHLRPGRGPSLSPQRSPSAPI